MTRRLWAETLYLAVAGFGAGVRPAREPDRGPLAPLVTLLPARALRGNCPSFLDSASTPPGRRFLCEGDRPLYSLITDTTGAIRVVGYGGIVGRYAQADSVVAFLARTFGRPRRCGRDDWRWRIPDGDVNVRFERSSIPTERAVVWYMSILAQWREPRFARGDGWAPCGG